MAYLSALDQILSERNVLVAIAAILAMALWRGWTGLPAVMQQWIAGRQQRAAEEAARRQAIAAERDAAWKRLREEIDRLAGFHAECERNLAAEREARHHDVSVLRDELAAERAERMKWQRIEQAEGEIRQAAASAAAEIRVADHDKKRREGEGK